MAIIEVPWIQLPKPKENYELLKNGKKGVVFKLSQQYVGKILYKMKGEDYWLRDDNAAIEELAYEENINKILYVAGIGNVPKPMGIEKLGIYGKTYPVFIMEYIKNLPHGDALLTPYDQYIAESLVKKEVYQTVSIDLFPGKDYLHPWNYFYDKNKSIVRLIDFGRWTMGDVLVSPYDTE